MGEAELEEVRTFASSAEKDMRAQMEKMTLEFTDAKSVMQAETSALQQELADNKAELESTKAAASREVAVLKDELLHKSTEFSEVESMLLAEREVELKRLRTDSVNHLNRISILKDQLEKTTIELEAARDGQDSWILLEEDSLG